MIKACYGVYGLEKASVMRDEDITFDNSTIKVAHFRKIVF